jgi:iron complex transport system ATP-binding protein
MILSVQGLAFYYPSRQVLQDIDFAVLQGDCMAILGTNGVGKSTLLKCLNRILKPQSGVVIIQEDEVLKLNRTELAQRMGYVAQQHESARCTVFDAVLLGAGSLISNGTSPGKTWRLCTGSWHCSNWMPIH